MSFHLETTAFAQGGKIPKLYTCEGRNISPPLVWSGPPAGAQSYVLVCEDPDAPSGLFYHWGVYDIPGNWRNLPEDIATATLTNGFRQGVNSFGKTGYGGPCPPRGHGLHYYIFHLYAVSARTLPMGQRPDCAAIKNAAQDVALAAAQIVGVYERQ